MSAWRSCGRSNFTSCMFLLSLNRICQAFERSLGNRAEGKRNRGVEAGRMPLSVEVGH